MTKSEKLKMCQGCRDNFYNGNNDLGVKECWALDSAKLIKRKKIHVNQRPPWNQKPISVLSCYSQPSFVFWE